MDGVSKQWYDNGQLRVEANYKDGKLDGVYKEWYDNGQLRVEANYKDGNRDGVYKQWHDNGQLRVEANYKDGELDGVSKQWYDNGQLRVDENYKDGKLDGVSKQWYDNGQLRVEQNYKDDKLDGVSKQWYDNGQLRFDENYKDGKLDGVYKQWYDNGKLTVEANYKDDKLDGVRKQWYDNGQLRFDENYKDEKLDGVYKQWHDNGQLRVEQNYKDGKLDGVSKQWYDNGQLRVEQNYKDGNRDGVYKEWYGNGQLRVEQNYKDGKLDGVSRVWDSDGKLINEDKKEMYQKNTQGKIIGKTTVRDKDTITEQNKAFEILIDSVNQKADTLPHEYAHVYIEMFKDTPIVQEAIKRYGTVEKLVQAIGEQVVKQNGEALNWWNRFTKWLLNLLTDKEILQILTDGLIERRNLKDYEYGMFEKQDVSGLIGQNIMTNITGRTRQGFKGQGFKVVRIEGNNVYIKRTTDGIIKRGIREEIWSISEYNDNLTTVSKSLGIDLNHLKINVKTDKELEYEKKLAKVNKEQSEKIKLAERERLKNRTQSEIDKETEEFENEFVETESGGKEGFDFEIENAKKKKNRDTDERVQTKKIIAYSRDVVEIVNQWKYEKKVEYVQEYQMMLDWQTDLIVEKFSEKDFIKYADPNDLGWMPTLRKQWFEKDKKKLGEDIASFAERHNIKVSDVIDFIKEYPNKFKITEKNIYHYLLADKYKLLTGRDIKNYETDKDYIEKEQKERREKDIQQKIAEAEAEAEAAERMEKVYSEMLDNDLSALFDNETKTKQQEEATANETVLTVDNIEKSNLSDEIKKGIQEGFKYISIITGENSINTELDVAINMMHRYTDFLKNNPNYTFEQWLNSQRLFDNKDLDISQTNKEYYNNQFAEQIAKAILNNSKSGIIKLFQTYKENAVTSLFGSKTKEEAINDTFKEPTEPSNDMGGVNYKGANVGGFNNTPPPPTGAEMPSNIKRIQLPEMIEFLKALTGDVPTVKNLGDLLRGRHKAGKITLNIEAIEKSVRQEAEGKGWTEEQIEEAIISQIEKTFAHEIGHLDNWVKHKKDIVGNIGTRIQNLKKSFAKFFPFKPGGEGYPTKERIEELKKLADERAKANTKIIEEYKEKYIIEEVPILPQDITDIWNNYFYDKTKNPELYEYVARLSSAEKVRILKLAMKQIVADELKRFTKTKEVSTGIFEKIITEIKGDKKAEFEKLLKDEIKRLKLFEEKVIYDELFELSKKWRPILNEKDKEYIKYRKSPQELYADAISVLFNDPDLLQREAPTFFKAFENYYSERPEFAEAFNDIQDLIRDPSTIAKQRFERIQQSYEEAAKKREEAARHKKGDSMTFFGRLIDTIVSSTRKFYKDVKSDKFIDKDLSVKANVQNKYEELAFHNDTWLFFNKMYEDVAKKFEATGLDMNDFGMILDFQSATSEKNKFKAASGGMMGEKITNEIIEYIFKKKNLTPEQIAEIQKVTNDFHEAFFEIVEKAKNVGLISEEIFKEKILPNKYTYATVVAKDYIDKNYVNWQTKVKKRKGSFGGKENPFISTILLGESFINAIKLQEAKLSYIDALKGGHIDGQTFEPAKKDKKGDFKPSEDKSKGVLEYFEDGKKVGVYVDKSLLEFFKQPKDIWQLNVLLMPFTMFNRMFRPLVTSYNPNFILITNKFRDTFRSVRNINTLIHSADKRPYYQKLLPIMRDLVVNPVRFMLDTKKSVQIINRLKQGKIDKELQEMLEVNAVDFFSGISQHYDFNAESDFNINKYMYKKGRKSYIERIRDKNKAIDFAVSFLQAPFVLRDALEFSSKYSSFKLLKKAGFSPSAAGLYVRNYAGTPNYREGGTYSKYTNQVFVFSNVIIQGLRTDFSLATKKQTRGNFWMNEAAMVIPPAILMGLAANGLLGDDIKKMISKISKYNLNNYVCIPIGETENGLCQYIRIPLDETSRFFYTTLLNSMNVALGNQDDKTKAIVQWTKDIIKLGGNFAPSPTPLLKIQKAWYDYLIESKNPDDEYYGKNVVGKAEFSAGWKTSLPEMVQWTVKQAGGKFILDIVTYNEKTNTTSHLNLPIINAIYFESNMGEMEKLREVVKRVQGNKSKLIIEKRETIKEIIYNETQSPDIKDLDIYFNKFKETYYKGKEEPTRQQLATDKKTVKIFILKGTKSDEAQLLGSLLMCKSAEEQTEIMMAYKKMTSKKDYLGIIKEAKFHDILYNNFEYENEKGKTEKYIKSKGGTTYITN